MAKQVGKYEIGRPLGEGQFGKVKEAVDMETGLRYAVKVIKKNAIKTKKDVDTVKKEVSFMKTLNGHPNILNMYDVMEDKEKLYLVLELAAGGDLFDKIVSLGGFNEEQARIYFKQLLNGLEHCHAKGIIHRDMKPENLLLGDNDVLKISDFGLSNIILTPGQMLQTHCGSEKYAAPEVMQTTDPYVGPPVDMWSTGVILYIMVGGAFPFVEATMNCELYASLVNGNFAWPKHFSEDLVDLLVKMFIIKPEERITLPEVLQHRWVNPQAAVSKVLETPAMDDGAFSMMQMDEEPVYRTLDPDIMSVDTAAFDEEPVYRSVDLIPQSATPTSSSEGCQKSLGFACRPTYQFSTSTPAPELLAKVAALFTERGATTVKVKEEKGQVKAEMKGESGDCVKVKVLIQTDATHGNTQVAMKRMKGHALDFCKMVAVMRPLVNEFCA